MVGSEIVVTGLAVLIGVLFGMVLRNTKELKDCREDLKALRERLSDQRTGKPLEPELMTNPIHLFREFDVEPKSKEEILNQEKKYDHTKIKGAFDDFFAG